MKNQIFVLIIASSLFCGLQASAQTTSTNRAAEDLAGFRQALDAYKAEMGQLSSRSRVETKVRTQLNRMEKTDRLTLKGSYPAGQIEYGRTSLVPSVYAEYRAKDKAIREQYKNYRHEALRVYKGEPFETELVKDLYLQAAATKDVGGETWYDPDRN